MVIVDVRTKMSAVRHVHTDAELETMIKGMGANRCTVVYFFLTWCGSCQKMNPFVDSIAVKNPKTLFIKVDAEKCIASTKRHRISKVPLFVLYNNRTRVDRVEGASPIELESKVKRIQNDIDYSKSRAVGGLIPSTVTTNGVKMSDLSPYLDKKNCRCLNDLLPTPIQGFLEGEKLVSGKGVGRLLLFYSFTERMVVQSFKIMAPVHSGPRVIKFFTNIAKNADISSVGQMGCAQEVTLSEEDLAGEHSVDLRQGGFIGINGIQVYIPENMTKSRRVELDYLILNGAPLALTPYAQMDPDSSATITKAGSSKNPY